MKFEFCDECRKEVSVGLRRGKWSQAMQLTAIERTSGQPDKFESIRSRLKSVCSGLWRSKKWEAHTKRAVTTSRGAARQAISERVIL